jgi:hypothetical protein
MTISIATLRSVVLTMATLCFGYWLVVSAPTDSRGARLWAAYVVTWAVWLLLAVAVGTREVWW